MFYTAADPLKTRPTEPSETMEGLERPDHMPPRGPNWARRFAWRMLRRGGWDIRGKYPDAPKFLIIGAPHSSNFDWYWGMYVQWALGVRFSYMIKAMFFWPPLSWLLRYMGGLPVDRDKPGGLIGAAIEAYNAHDKFVMLITPEGRTKPVQHLKRGFYEIAKGADVPVLVVSFRYDERVMSLDGYLDLSGTYKDVQERLLAHYGTIKGRHRGYLDNLENWAVSPLPKDTTVFK